MDRGAQKMKSALKAFQGVLENESGKCERKKYLLNLYFLGFKNLAFDKLLIQGGFNNFL